MSTCPRCGKKGLFLRLGKYGLCKQCESEMMMFVPDRIRLIDESSEIINKSDNVETVLSRTEFKRLKLEEIIQFSGPKIDPFLLLGYSTDLATLYNTTKDFENSIKKWVDSIFELLRAYLKENGPVPFKNFVSIFKDNPDCWIDEYDITKSLRSLLEYRGSSYGILKEKIKNKYYYYLDDQETMLNQIKEGGIPSDLSLCTPKLDYSSDLIELLWIKNGPFQNFQDDSEPSLIDLSLPIDKNISSEDFEEDIGYYPNYVGLTPKQRYIYLNWLKDITQPIPIGYVFIFYYGLERYLLTPKYMLAVDKIVELIKHFDNPSFRSYATDALLIASALNNDPEIISKIPFWENMPTSVYFYFKAQMYHEFSADDLIKNSRFWDFTNKRYINNEPTLFKNELERILLEKYGCAAYPIDPTELKNTNSKTTLVLANYSLTKRVASFPNLSGNSKITSEIKELLQAAHESVKALLRKKRSAQKSIKSEPLPTLVVNGKNQD